MILNRLFQLCRSVKSESPLFLPNHNVSEHVKMPFFASVDWQPTTTSPVIKRGQQQAAAMVPSHHASCWQLSCRVINPAAALVCYRQVTVDSCNRWPDDCPQAFMALLTWGWTLLDAGMMLQPQPPGRFRSGLLVGIHTAWRSLYVQICTDTCARMVKQN